MRKFLTPLFISLVLLISACGASNEPEPTATIIVEPTAETVIETATVPLVTLESDAVCVVETPTDDFFEEGDWVEGLEEGFSVTVIEYGDYQ